jgi:excisionase family DNA binding protein
MLDRFLTPDQVAEILQLHPFTILGYIKTGSLRAARIGRVYRIKENDVSAFLESQIVTVESNKTPEPLTTTVS